MASPESFGRVSRARTPPTDINFICFCRPQHHPTQGKRQAKGRQDRQQRAEGSAADERNLKAEGDERPPGAPLPPFVRHALAGEFRPGKRRGNPPDQQRQDGQPGDVTRHDKAQGNSREKPCKKTRRGKFAQPVGRTRPAAGGCSGFAPLATGQIACKGKGTHISTSKNDRVASIPDAAAQLLCHRLSDGGAHEEEGSPPVHRRARTACDSLQDCPE